jgi:hypothetical protein
MWITRDPNALAIIKGEWPPVDRSIDEGQRPISGALDDVISDSLETDK